MYDPTDEMDEYRREAYMDRNGYDYCSFCEAIGDWPKYEDWGGVDDLHWCGDCEAPIVYSSHEDESFETPEGEIIHMDNIAAGDYRIWFDKYRNE